MIDKKNFKKSIAIPLEKAGFQKRGQSWYLDGKDAITVVNLQKCDWGDLYYINIGIYLKGLGSESFPSEKQWHIDIRIERLFPEQRELILLSCSLESSNPQMISMLSEFLERQLIPFLQKCSELENLKTLMVQGIFDWALVIKEARWYLSD